MMQPFSAIQTLLLLLLLLAGVVLPTEATKEGGSSANTTLQVQPAGKHHVQKVRHTQSGWGQMAAHVGYTDLYTHNSYALAQCFVLYVMSNFNWGQYVS